MRNSFSIITYGDGPGLPRRPRHLNVPRNLNAIVYVFLIKMVELSHGMAF